MISKSTTAGRKEYLFSYPTWLGTPQIGSQVFPRLPARNYWRICGVYSLTTVWLKPPLHLIHHVIHQPLPPRLGPGEPQQIALRRLLAPDRQALLKVQHPAGAGGGGGGGFFFAAFGLDQGGQEGGPLGGEGLAVNLFQHRHNQVGEAAARGGGEAEDVPFQHNLGRGEEAVQCAMNAHSVLATMT